MSDFWDMTLSEWDAWQQGYMMRQEDTWRQVRWLGTIICNSSGKTYKEALEPSDLMPLPSDPNKVVFKKRNKQGKLDINVAYQIAEKYHLQMPQIKN